MWDILFCIELIFSVAFGLAIGSFANVCIDRIPLQSLSLQKKEELLSSPEIADQLKSYIASDRLNIAVPVRSICFACGHQLLWFENIPILSYLLLRGRCRQCQTSYGMRSFNVELLNGVAYGVITNFFQWTWIALWLCLHCSFIFVVGTIYKEHGFIPRGLCFIALVLGLLDIGFVRMS